MDAILCAQQECFDQNFYVFAEPTDNLTKLKAVESTISTPATCERCGLTSVIEHSVSLSLVPVVLALQLKESDLVAFRAPGSSMRSNLAEQVERLASRPGAAQLAARGRR